MTSRDELVDTHPCPKCGAKRRGPCQGKRGPRVSCHVERWEAAGVSHEDLRALGAARSTGSTTGRQPRRPRPPRVPRQ